MVATTTRACPVPTKRGTACPHTPARDGLCPLHHPEATYARQHEGYRAKLLRRPEVLAALARATPAPPTPLPVTVTSSRPTGSAASSPTPSRPAPGTYLAELEYAAAYLERVLRETPLDGGEVEVARWNIARRYALEAYADARALVSKRAR